MRLASSTKRDGPSPQDCKFWPKRWYRTTKYTAFRFAALLADPTAFGTHTEERSAVYALRETWRRRPALRPAVTGVLERLPAGVADEVRWQIEYLP